jgi:two-component system, cell cycle response regulator DivK
MEVCVSKKHALIVDDNALNVNVLARLLATEGVDNTSVLEPLELAAVLDQLDAVNVVFLDLEMPHIDGYQVLEQLKGDERFRSVPIVAYTVHVSEMKESLNQGFDGFIGKPLNSDRFPDQLSRILNGEPVWEAM